jgi:hypothetical protein
MRQLFASNGYVPTSLNAGIVKGGGGGGGDSVDGIAL